MNSFRIKLSKGTILPFSFLLQLRLGNWKLCFLILSLHKKFYFLTLFTTPNSSIYPEWFHSGSEWIHSVLEWIHTVPEYIHSGLTFLIVFSEPIINFSSMKFLIPVLSTNVSLPPIQNRPSIVIMCTASRTAWMLDVAFGWASWPPPFWQNLDARIHGFLSSKLLRQVDEDEENIQPWGQSWWLRKRDANRGFLRQDKQRSSVGDK